MHPEGRSAAKDGAGGCILGREEWGFAPGENTADKPLHRLDRQALDKRRSLPVRH
jgi:hypothetical protein